MEIWPLENSFIETWPPGSATLLVSHRGATYIVLLALSVGIELVSSATVSQSVSQLSFKKIWLDICLNKAVCYFATSLLRYNIPKLASEKNTSSLHRYFAAIK